MWRAALLVGVSYSTLVSTAAQAAEATAPPADQRGGMLEEIVVTARKREESLQVAPLSVSAATGANLEKAQLTRIDNLAQIAPSLIVSETIGYPASINLRLRGIGSSDTILTNDSPVAMYVDGVYLGRTAGALVNLVDIARVEVLRGPQGSLFGRNTTGGAISITTRTPAEDFGGQVQLSYASQNEFTGLASIDTGDIAHTGITGRITYRRHQMDGYLRNTLTSKRKSPGADDANQFIVALHAEPTSDLSIDYKFDYINDYVHVGHFQIRYALPSVVTYLSNSPNVGGDPFILPATDVQTSFASTLTARAQNKVYGNSLTMNYFVSDALKLKSITGYRGFHSEDASDLSGSGPLLGFSSLCPPALGIPGCSIPETVQTVSTYRAPFDHQKQFQISQEFQASGTYKDLTYLVGLFYFSERAREYQPSTINLPLVSLGFPNIAPFNVQALTVNSLLSYGVKSSSKAAFTQVSWSPSQIFHNKLELTGGLRYTEDRKRLDQNDTNAVRNLRASFNKWTYAASVKYQWTEDAMTYARFSTGYKAGGFSARSVVNGLSTSGAYLPEVATSYELGGKVELLDHRVRINASVFKTKYDDFQTGSLFVLNGRLVTQTYNAGKVDYKGGEIEFSILPAAGWRLEGNYGYVDPVFKQYLVSVPATAGSSVPVLVDIAKLAKYPQVAKTTAAFSVQYTFPPSSFGDLTLRADWTYRSALSYTTGNFVNVGGPTQATAVAGKQTFSPMPYVTDATRSPPWDNVGAQIILDNLPLGHGASWKLTLFGKNLLNKRDLLSGLDLTGLGIIPGGWGRGRVFGAMGSVKF
jgi:iron complex outermembrane receptor protein